MNCDNTVPIIEIERFAIHDGPGIRTIVFFQGCPLSCPWCANPESQKIRKHIMYKKDSCVGCQTCVNICPKEVITYKDGRCLFERDKCIGCRLCENNCLTKSINITGERKTIDEILDIIDRDKDYYEVSGGGITFSGGEPFAQTDKLIEFMKKAKCKGYHISIETCGATDWQWIEKSIPYVDCYLFDVKHYNAEKLSEIVKGNGYKMLENFKTLSNLVPEKMIARVPVIPNYNFEVLNNILDFIADTNVSSVHLLPYHNLGTGKYEQLDQEYLLTDTPMMKKEELIPYKEYGISKGLQVQIGG